MMGAALLFIAAIASWGLLWAAIARIDGLFEEDWAKRAPIQENPVAAQPCITEYRCCRCGRMEYAGSRDLWRIEDWKTEKLCYRCKP